MHAGDHDVHLLQHGVGEIELAVGEDVHLDAGHDGDAIGLLVGGTNARNVLLGTLVIETVGEGQILRVIGDGDVLVAALFGRGRHLVDGALPVGFDGMHVHFAANIIHGDQVRAAGAWPRPRSRRNFRAARAGCNRA